MRDRIRKSFVFAALSALFHWSLAFVVLIGGIAIYLVHASSPNPRDVATPIFLLSGTLVALVLPAASLSAAYVEPRMSYWADELAKNDADMAAVSLLGRGAIKTMKGVVAPLWRGFIYAMVSLPLSAAALFKPALQIGSYSAEELLESAALAFLIAAPFSFLPFVWAILQFTLLRDALSMLFVDGGTASGTKSAAASNGSTAATIDDVGTAIPVSLLEGAQRQSVEPKHRGQIGTGT